MAVTGPTARIASLSGSNRNSSAPTSSLKCCTAEGLKNKTASDWPASIAATGFGLTALCIAGEHGWVAPAQTRERALNTLRYFSTRAFQEHGWFYHWLDTKTGDRRWKSEVSSIDTALLLAGILTVRQYYRRDAEIFRLATKIYERVDFRWMLNGDPLLLSHGWRPETGFLKPRWDTYSEDTILYLLAIGSPTHPISAASWYALWRDRYRYEGHSYFTTIGVPLFMHQYAHAWIDYRNRRPDYLKAWIDNLVNWEYVDQLFSKA